MSREDANPMEDRHTDDAVSVSADEVGFRIQTDFDEEQTVLQKELFMCAWEFVSSWISDNLEAAILKRNSRRVLSYCWHLWVEEAAIFPPPLVSSSDSDDGFPHGGPSFLAARTYGDGVCAMHSIFGSQTIGGEYFLANARAMAVEHFSERLEDMLARHDDTQLVDSNCSRMWNEFMVGEFQGAPTVEGNIFM